MIFRHNVNWTAAGHHATPKICSLPAGDHIARWMVRGGTVAWNNRSRRSDATFVGAKNECRAFRSCAVPLHQLKWVKFWAVWKTAIMLKCIGRRGGWSWGRTVLTQLMFERKERYAGQGATRKQQLILLQLLLSVNWTLDDWEQHTRRSQQQRNGVSQEQKSHFMDNLPSI